MKEPNYAKGSPFKRNKMRIYFQFSMIGLACVVIVVVISLLVNRKPAIDYSDADFVQINEPSDSAQVVVFETTEGSFKAVLFEDEAPEYCEYFKGLVNDGYFDDTYVCTIIRTNDLIGGFIGGSKTEDGASADNTNNDKVNIEVSKNILPLNGTLCSLVQQGGMFRKAKAGSLFTVLGDVVDVDELRSLDAKDVNGFKRVSDMFEQYGGVPSCLQTYTLFGQVYDGWDTLEKIMNTEVTFQDDEDNVNQKPKKEIRITKAYLSTYGENKENGYNIPKKAALPEESAADESK